MLDPTMFFVGRKLTRRTSNKIPGLPKLDESDQDAGNFQIVEVGTLWSPNMIALRLNRREKLVGNRFSFDPNELERLRGPFVWEFEDTESTRPESPNGAIQKRQDNPGSRMSYALQCLRCGVVARGDRNFEVAAKQFAEALKVATSLGDRELIAGLCHELGRNAQDQRDFSAAEVWYRKALETEGDAGHGQ